LPFIGYLLFWTIGIFMTIIFLDKYETATTGAIIFFLTFLLLCYFMVGLLSYRFKIVLLTEEEIKVIIPFRFQFQEFKFSDVAEIKWDLWGTYRTGDYRKLIITNSSGLQTNISDLEFINYDSLEKWILERTSLTLNLERKLNVELQQAKVNRWLNLFIIVVFIFFFFLLSSGQRDNNINIGIRIAMVFITWRLIVRLVQYQKRINENNQRRGLRKEKPAANTVHDP
jgi:hypothetical protein